MLLSMTLDESICNDLGVNKYLEQYINKVDGFELTPHDSLFDKESITAISYLCSQHDKSINYHAPEFVSPCYDIASFKYDALSVKEAYIKLLGSIYDIQSVISKTGIMAIHGASIDSNRNESINTTLRFFDWLLNYIDRKNENIYLSLETLPNRMDTVGTTRSEVVDIVNEFNSHRLGICLDMTHDLYNHEFNFKKLPDELLSNVNYTHLHGINKSTTPVLDHIGLRDSADIFNDFFKSLKSVDYKGYINLELLSRYTDDYISEMNQSISGLKELLV